MDNFKEWLQTMGQQFLELTNEERNQTFNYLLYISGSSQLTYMAKILPSLMYRDYFKLLPKELSIIILQYLDSKSLFNCLLVSHHWHHLINSLPQVWRHLCLHHCIIDFCILQTASYYKMLFLKVSALQLKPLKRGEAFVESLFLGHHKRLMVVHYHKGKLLTGSDDRTVNMWNCDTGECQVILHARSVSDIKLEDDFIYASSFDGSVECWQIPNGFSRRFLGHVSAVYSIDVCMELSMLVTGSADLTMKVWHISSGQLLTTLAGHHHDWIIKVKAVSKGLNNPYILISADKKVCCVWQMASNHILKEVHVIQFSNYQIIPHLIFENNSLMKICFMSYISKNAFIRIYDLKPDLTLLEQHELPLSIDCVQLLLGVGHRLALVIDSNKCLSIFNLHSKEVIMKKPLPAIRVTTSGTSVTAGPTDWLNGFTTDTPTGVVLGAGLNDHSIYILKWEKNSGLQFTEHHFNS